MTENLKSFRPWSYSRMGVARKCPYLFRRQYIDGVEQPTTPPLRVGQATHEVIARYGLHCAANKRQTDYEAMQTIITACRNMVVTPEERDAVREVCTRFAEQRLIEPNWHFEGRVAVDAEWKPIDYDSPLAYFRGRIDCSYVDGEDNLVIIDYYSGWHRPDEFLKKDQLSHYALLEFAHHPELDNAVCFADFLRYSGQDASVEFQATRDAVEYLKGEIASLDSKYAQERDFLPTPNEGCKYCYLVRECPAVIQAVRDIPLPEIDAAQLYLIRIAADEKMKRLKGEPAGIWEVGDMTLGHHQTSSEKYRFRDVVETLMRKTKSNDTARQAMQDIIYGVVDNLSLTDAKKIVGQVNKANLFPKKLELADFRDARFYKSGLIFTFKGGEDASPLPEF